MSLDYYNSLMETVHLLRSPANAAHLDRFIAQFKSGNAEKTDCWVMSRLLAWTDDAWRDYWF